MNYECFDVMMSSTAALKPCAQCVGTAHVSSSDLLTWKHLQFMNFVLIEITTCLLYYYL